MSYLHRCLDLHGEVTARRYGKVQRLDAVERDVQDILADDGGLWDVIRTIHDHPQFGADMFGFLPAQVERELKDSEWHSAWRTLSPKELIAKLYGTFRQIEPASMVLRFLCPERYGIKSSPVEAILGVRPERSPTDTYDAYLRSLGEIRLTRGFRRVADVEMALWALQVGVLQDRLLPDEKANALRRDYRSDTALRQLATRNLIVQIFRQNSKLDVAEALLSTDVEAAGLLASKEFEQLVGKQVGVGKARGARESPDLNALINRLADKQLQNRCHEARLIRNRAVHELASVARKDVKRLIAIARDIET